MGSSRIVKFLSRITCCMNFALNRRFVATKAMIYFSYHWNVWCIGILNTTPRIKTVLSLQSRTWIRSLVHCIHIFLSRAERRLNSIICLSEYSARRQKSFKKNLSQNFLQRTLVVSVNFYGKPIYPPACDFKVSGFSVTIASTYISDSKDKNFFLHRRFVTIREVKELKGFKKTEVKHLSWPKNKRKSGIKQY